MRNRRGSSEHSPVRVAPLSRSIWLGRKLPAHRAWSSISEVLHWFGMPGRVAARPPLLWPASPRTSRTASPLGENVPGGAGAALALSTSWRRQEYEDPQQKTP